MKVTQLVRGILLFCALISRVSVKGQPCPITNVEVRFYPEEYSNFIDSSALTFIVNGAVRGGTPSNVTWRRNGAKLNSRFETISQLSGVCDGTFFIGGLNVSDNPCENKINYRTAVNITGRAPGEYSLTVTNNDTNTSISNSTIIYRTNSVTNLTITQFDDDRLRASWTAPVNTGTDMELVDYRVIIYNECINSNGAIIPAGTTTYTLPGTYTPGTTVTVHVRATSMHYWSIIQTAQYTVKVPTVVVNVTDTTDLISVLLTWSESSPPNVVITNYTITYSINGNSTITNLFNTTNFKISELLPQTEVSGITITAATSVGPSLTVSYHDVTTLGLPQIQNVTVMILTNTSLRVSWDDPLVNSITHYKIKYTLQENNTKQSHATIVNIPASSAEIMELMNNVQITLQVISCAEIEGTEYTGEPFVMNIVILKADDPLSTSERSDKYIIISNLAVFFGTIILYSIVLGLIIACCCYHSYKIQEENERSPEIVMNECEAYKNVKAQESSQTYTIVTR